MTGIEAVIVRKGKDSIEILIQIRRITEAGRKANYDPLYDGSKEGIGGTFENSWETTINAVIRESREETNRPDFQPEAIIGSRGKIDQESSRFSTRPGEDLILMTFPYAFLEQEKGPQPWKLACYVVQAPPDFEPGPPKEGIEPEANGFQWWKPETLLAEIERNPAGFFMYLPFLRLVCQDILSGRLQI